MRTVLGVELFSNRRLALLLDDPLAAKHNMVNDGEV